MTKRAIDLKVGETGVVSNFTTEDIPGKLLEMGCLPGTEMELKYTAPFNGPLVLRIANSEIAIRRDLASKIILE
ncbi:MAG: FeoA family protein [Schleiferiaceae bacterium]|jgi:ferrous iron transport protein A